MPHTLPAAAGKIAGNLDPVAPTMRSQACQRCGGHQWLPGAGRWVCSACGDVGGAMAVAAPPADDRKERLGRIAARLSGRPGQEAA